MAKTKAGNFYGVYLLYCSNPKYEGRVYVGYTVNPKRRIAQHNAGKRKGGAWRTSGRGPWEMVLIIHGFPSDVAALRFEWAWQHPRESRRLWTLTRRARAEGSFDFHLRILWEMLRLPPWNRLPLTLRWLRQEYQREWPPGSAPPPHIPLAFGQVRAPTSRRSGGKRRRRRRRRRGRSGGAGERQSDGRGGAEKGRAHCDLCSQEFTAESEILTCVHSSCSSRTHLLCLAQTFLEGDTSQLIPLEGRCPSCRKTVLWGHLVRYKNGHHDDFKETPSSSSSSQGHWTADLDC